MNETKADFLRRAYIPYCAQLNADAIPLWGKMNVQQMVEHMADYVRIASGKTPMQVVTEPERLPRMQGFLMSEKPFPENTPNALLPDTPPAVKHKTLENAITELQEEIEYFFQQAEQVPEQQHANPFFGVLNWEQQVQLLHKHATHHLRQFGVTEQQLSH